MSEQAKKFLMTAVKYAASVLACTLFYRYAYAWLNAAIGDTRFLTFALQGLLTLAVALTLFYVLASRVVFLRKPRRDGSVA